MHPRAPRFAVRRIELFERPTSLRLPFRFGSTTVTQAPQAFVRVEIEFAGGRRARGATAELMVPLVNKTQIRAAYAGASAEQIAAIYRYRQVVLNAYVEVLNQLSQISNINQSYDLKAQQVSALSRAIDVSILLFKTARADYAEVLLTQRDALESRIELVDLKQQQANALVRAYRALGGGFTHGPVDPEDDAPSI